ncbi:regulator of G protein signaling superfamily [Mytilinidion resinicola]|uniref:Regulator of G protein signaling superfamily n=1 Tax=Mytilinidion resinicola TaxID=574789 RepID=A0A6A6YMG1_9PEZI|nr:regulator of G protein signaling superfamily [Mytilinidion resinicola]KAF2809739.1 regulator of G protein signaling superfamily [Mytilinidion resinicola]
MHSRKAGTLRITTSSAASSPRCSSAYDSDADDEGNMAEYLPSRPLTVSIPRGGYAAGPYCPRRPTLSEILANTAPPPWTLSAFMAYLSQNHCLETLEFTMDASRYRQHYSKMAARNPGSPISPLSDDCTYVKMLWQRLLDAYIAPNGPREVNLPSDVRDSLLAQSNPYIPPHPATLDPAVAKIYELMEESVLTPFLNSLCPQTATPGSAYEGDDVSLSRTHTRSYDERGMYSRNSSPTAQRASAPSSLTSNFLHSRNAAAHGRFASGPPATSSSSAMDTSGSDALTDDSGSASSPSGLDDPMTPPTTPPMSEFSYGNSYYDSQGTTPSPRLGRGDHSSIAGATKDGWKRVSSKLWPKKRSGGALREEDQSPMEGGLF